MTSDITESKKVSDLTLLTIKELKKMPGNFYRGGGGGGDRGGGRKRLPSVLRGGPGPVSVLNSPLKLHLMWQLCLFPFHSVKTYPHILSSKTIFLTYYVTLIKYL